MTSRFTASPADRWRLRLLPVLILVQLVTVVLGLNLWYLREQTLTSGQGRASAHAAAIKEQLVRTLFVVRHTLDDAAALQAQYALPAQRTTVEAGLRQAIHQAPDVDGLFLLGPDGRVLADSHASPADLHLNDRAFFMVHQAPQSPDFYLDIPVLSRRTGHWQLTMSTPIRDTQGRLLAVAAVTMDPERLVQGWAHMDLTSEDRALLMRSDGTVLARYPFDALQMGVSFAPTPLFRDRLNQASHGTFRRDGMVDGAARLYAYQRLKDGALDLVCLVGISEANLLAPWWNVVQLSLLATFLLVPGLWILVNLWRDANARRINAEGQATLRAHALQSVSQGVLISDPQGRTLWVNHAFKAITGYSGAELLGQPCSVLQGTGTDAATRQAIREALQRHEGIECEILNYRKDGTPFWNELSITPITDEQGVLTHFVGVQRDITERHHQLQEGLLMQRIFEQAHAGITITDAQGTILRTNGAFSAITGYAAHEVLGKNPRILQSGLQSSGFYEEMWHAILGQGRWNGEIYNRHKNGTVYPEWLTISAVHDEQGAISHFVGTFTDLTRLKSAENQAHRLSHYDPLTGLPNQLVLQDRTAHLIRMMNRSQEPLCLLHLGVDQFKAINDSHGHGVGDLLLCEVAKRLSEGVREQDTVSHRAGKEFSILLPSTTTDGAAHLAGELLWKLAQPYPLADRELHVTVSIGIAAYPENGTDFESLYKSAEIAMHRAQIGAGDNFKFYSDDMYQEVLAKEQLTRALRKAAPQGQLQLLYQPLADLQSGQICGMEALLRWSHPELGTVSPGKFIPLAEETGAIRTLGYWVLEQACKDITTWQSQGMTVPPVAINVSAVQFRDNDFVPSVKEIVARCGLAPGAIVLEVTESALIDDVERCETVLRGLKQLGVGLSLDDFGTGYSSLSYLKRYPFDKVKIDQSFIREVSHSEVDAVIVKVIISMAHGLGLRVVAEGVESELQCDFVRNHVCDEIQGYFLSRPVDAANLHEMLRTGKRLPDHLLRFRQPQRTLLLVDDEPNVLSALKRLFRRDGYQIFTANSGAEGLEVLSQIKVDVIISDQRMPGMSGVEFLREAKVRCPDTIRIVLSGYTELQSVTDAINEGSIYRFLTKPWDDEQLREQINKAFKHMELIEQNRQLDIKIRTTNQELVAANRHLGELIATTREQVKTESVSLNVMRDALQSVPVPIIGIDDQGVICLTNEAADRVFSGLGGLLGLEASAIHPQLTQWAQESEPTEPRFVFVAQQRYALRWNAMGRHSSARGILMSFTPCPMP